MKRPKVLWIGNFNRILKWVMHKTEITSFERSWLLALLASQSFSSLYLLVHRIAYTLISIFDVVSFSLTFQGVSSRVVLLVVLLWLCLLFNPATQCEELNVVSFFFPYFPGNFLLWVFFWYYFLCHYLISLKLLL